VLGLNGIDECLSLGVAFERLGGQPIRRQEIAWCDLFRRGFCAIGDERTASLAREARSSAIQSEVHRDSILAVPVSLQGLGLLGLCLLFGIHGCAIPGYNRDRIG
jgi:hypothetical protein